MIRGHNLMRYKNNLVKRKDDCYTEVIQKAFVFFCVILTIMTIMPINIYNESFQEGKTTFLSEEFDEINYE